MAKKVILKDLNDIEVLPITRGELVLDASGNPALHSTLFLATDSLPGLMSSEDKYKLDHLEDSGPGANNKVAQINTTTDDVYRLLFSETADDTDRTEKSRKSANLTFNPSTGVLNLTGTINTNAEVINGLLTINRDPSFIQFKNNGTVLGYLGFLNANTPGYYTNDASKFYKFWTELTLNPGDYLTKHNPVYTGILRTTQTGFYLKAETLFFRNASDTADYGTQIVNVWNDGTEKQTRLILHKTGIIFKDATGYDNEVYHKGNLKNLSDLNDDVVSGKYLPLTGGTISGNLSVDGIFGVTGYINVKRHYLFAKDNDNADWIVTNKDWTKEYTLIHSGNIGSQSVGNASTADKLKNKVKIWGLDFDGSSDVKGNLTLGYNKIYIGDGTDSFYIGWGAGNLYQYNNYYGHYFSTKSGEVMRINSSGNVGIGTTNPQYKLDVKGVIYTNSQVVSPYFMAGLGVEGLYMSAGGISWHDTTYNYKAVLIACAQNAIALKQPTTVDSTLSVIGTGTFNSQIISKVADGTAPLVVTSTSRVDNLNADAVDGFHMRQWFTNASDITNTAMFWQASGNCSDISSMGYAALINVIGDTGRRWQIWNSRGDHLLYWRPEKSDMSDWADVHTLIDDKNISNYLPKVTDYYWANVLISKTSNDKTTPTFGGATINGIISGVHKIQFTALGANGISYGQYGNPQLGPSSADWTLYDKDGEVILRGTPNKNVGINVTNPKAKLHVVGSSTDFTAPVGLTENSATGTSWYAIHAFTNPSMSTGEYAAIQIGKKLNTKNCGHLSFYYAGDSSDNNRFALGFYNAIDLLVVKADGKVGIGTTSPTRALDVNGVIRARLANNKDILLEGATDNLDGAGIAFWNPSSGWHLGTINAKTLIINTATSGNVGIGTTNPSYKLHVNGTAKATSLMSSNIRIECDNNGVLGSRGSEINNYNGHLYLNHHSGTHIIMATGGGNVGIGTGNPAYKLDVSGTAKANKVLIYDGTNAVLSLRTTTAGECAYLAAYNTGGQYGADVVLHSGSAMVLGAGESAASMYDNNVDSLRGSENLYLTADLLVKIFTNCDSIGNRRHAATFTTDGYSFFHSYINIGGHEKNASSPSYVWGSNSSDNYLRSYLTSSLSVGYASSSTVWSRTWQRGNNALIPLANYHNQTRVFMVDSDTSNRPNSSAGFIIANAWDWGGGGSLIYQDFDTDYGRLFTNAKTCDGSYQGWKKVAWTTDIPTTMAWGSITGKPSTFTPSSHTHDDRYYTESEADSRFVNYTGDTMTGNLTVPSLFINTGDPTLKIYSGKVTDAKSDGNICLQTCIDGLDGQTHSHAPNHPGRENLVLLPRGGQVYIGTNPDSGNTSYKLWVNGNTYASGSLYAAHFYENSDAKLKENIQAILDRDNIPQIKEFDWKESGEHSYGLIAQELEEQGYSELVSTKDDGYKTVNYSAALSLIVGKLQVKIKELEKEIEILKNKN